MARTQDTAEQVKTAPLTHQVTERNSLGNTYVVAAFDRPEDAEAFAALDSRRRARVDPHWTELQKWVRDLRRPVGVTDELAGRDA